MTLEYLDLKPGVEYVIRYQISDRELVQNSDSQTSSSSAACKLPFITQQILIIDTKLVKHRLNHWKVDVYDEDKNHQETELI